MDIKIFDCTISNGRTINHWSFNKKSYINVINKLTEANIDIIDIGYLEKSNKKRDDNIATFDTINSVNKMMQENNTIGIYAVRMSLERVCDIDELEKCDVTGISIIRLEISASIIEEDEFESKLFACCEKIIQSGYKLCVNLQISPTCDQVIYRGIINLIRNLDVYEFCIEDKLGLYDIKKLQPYYEMANELLKSETAFGYCGHNNILQSYEVIQGLIKSNYKRTIIIDTSIGGIGEGIGILSTEYVAKYLNESNNLWYKFEALREVYFSEIEKLLGQSKWGYALDIMVCAKYNCNPLYFQKLLEYCVNDELDDVMQELSKYEQHSFSEDLLERTLYEVRKKKTSLAIIVPSANRPEIIKFWIDKNAKTFYCYGVDLIFYDSSDKDNAKHIRKLVEECTYSNVKYVYYDGIVDDVICDKVYSASAEFCQQYDYVWITRDRSVVNIEPIISDLRYGYKEKMDFMVVYPHYLPEGWYDRQEYTDCAKLFRKLCGEMTSLGSIIFSGSVLKILVDDYPVDEEKNRGLWLVMPLFQYIGEHNFRALYFAGQAFTALPYSSSYWIKKQTLLPLFSKRWNRMLDLLPDSYKGVKEEVRNFEGWSIPPFGISMLMNGRASGDFSPIKVWKYRNELKRCAQKSLPQIWGISFIPAFFVRYYLGHKTTPLMRVMYWLFCKARSMLRLLISIVPRKKYAKPFSKIDYGKSVDAFAEDSNVESKLLVGRIEEVNNPELTIVIPTNNRADLLKDTLKSVELLQEVNYEWEVVIVDNQPYDGEKNQSQEIVEEMNNPRFLYYRNMKNIGATGNMNRGALLARGKWIAFLHDDDLLCQDYLERIDKIKKYLENKKKRVGLIFSECGMYFHDSFEKDRSAWPEYLRLNFEYTTRKDRYDVVSVTKGQFVFTGDSGLNAPTYGCLYLREAYIGVGGMRKEEDIGILADFTMNYRIMETYSAYRCTTPFGLYRWRNNESSGRVYDIICAYYDLREYIYRKHPIGKFIKGLLRYEHLYFNWATFAGLNYEPATRAFNELVSYKNNPLRLWMVKFIRKYYYMRQSKKRYHCGEIRK